MRRTFHLAVVAAMALTTVAAGEGEPVDPTEHPCYDETTEEVVYAEQQVWFHQSDNKVGNVAAPATWNETKPATSVQGGAGAGTLSPGFATLGNGAEQYATFAGTFEGCLDTLLVELYSFDPTNRTGTGGITEAPSGCLPDCVPQFEPDHHNFGLEVSVDGIPVISGGPYEAKTTLANEGFGPNLNQFALDLRQTMELFSDGGYLVLDGEHTIEITVRSWYVNTGHSVYVWDTSEVPSGASFNTDVPEGVPTL